MNVSIAVPSIVIRARSEFSPVAGLNTRPWIVPVPAVCASADDTKARETKLKATSQSWRGEQKRTVAFMVVGFGKSAARHEEESQQIERFALRHGFEQAGRHHRLFEDSGGT